VLENFLSEFQGCLLIISHDRYFMDRLVDHLLIFEGNGQVRDFPGNYSNYRTWQAQENKQLPVPEEEKPKAATAAEAVASPEMKKLSYKEKREFEQLAADIEKLNKEKQSISEQLNQGNLPYDELQSLSERLGNIDRELEEKEWRWLELSERPA
ncbi:MAG TPA: ABC transporter ATP-binding protein, partial [Chitinophagaceae bacterium]|nr:ABC transporter ATP-binding protein [Chitinophagaceae bacterium]